MAEKEKHINLLLRRIPNSPGVYQYLNKEGQIIYVGKAKILQNRLKSYFTGSHDAKTTRMLQDVVNFEYIITHSELEAFLLEANFIKKNRPKYNILLMHNPDYFPNAAQWGTDLVLSGHVHGGIVRIPGWKGVASPNIRFFPKYDGGKFEEGESVMILSRGLGVHTIPFRLFNPGELIVLDLEEEK